MQEVLKVAIPIIVVHVVVLIAIVAVVRLILIRQAAGAIARVKQVEDEVRKKEEQIRREIEDHEKTFASQKESAEREIQTRQDDAKREAASMKEQAAASAKADGQKILDQAHKDVDKMKEQLALQTEEKAVEYGGKVFKLVFSDLMTEELDRMFIAELIEALGEIEKGSITVESGEAEITTAHPLSEEQKSQIEEVLSSNIHEGTTITEQSDEALMGGLILKMGSLEIDGSLRNRYEESVEEVRKEAQNGAADAT